MIEVPENQKTENNNENEYKKYIKIEFKDWFSISQNIATGNIKSQFDNQYKIKQEIYYIPLSGRIYDDYFDARFYCGNKNITRSIKLKKDRINNVFTKINNNFEVLEIEITGESTQCLSKNTKGETSKERFCVDMELIKDIIQKTKTKNIVITNLTCFGMISAAEQTPNDKKQKINAEFKYFLKPIFENNNIENIFICNNGESATDRFYPCNIFFIEKKNSNKENIDKIKTIDGIIEEVKKEYRLVDHIGQQDTEYENYVKSMLIDYKLKDKVKSYKVYKFPSYVLPVIKKFCFKLHSKKKDDYKNDITLTEQLKYIGEYIKDEKKQNDDIKIPYGKGAILKKENNKKIFNGTIKDNKFQGDCQFYQYDNSGKKCFSIKGEWENGKLKKNAIITRYDDEYNKNKIKIKYEVYGDEKEIFNFKNIEEIYDDNFLKKKIDLFLKQEHEKKKIKKRLISEQIAVPHVRKTATGKTFSELYNDENYKKILQQELKNLYYLEGKYKHVNNKILVFLDCSFKRMNKIREKLIELVKKEIDRKNLKLNNENVKNALDEVLNEKNQIQEENNVAIINNNNNKINNICSIYNFLDSLDR